MTKENWGKGPQKVALGSNHCGCTASVHQCHLVVLTGGPGAGKSAALELARREFCQHVAVLPEAASILYGGGFWRKKTPVAQKAAQRAIFRIQREQELIAQSEGGYAVALCDRGTLDGLSYWPDSEESFFREQGSSREDELKRYAAVIHLRTPSAEFGYNNHSNPVRIETEQEAAELDERMVRSWEGHPRRFVVTSSRDFVEKINQTLTLLRQELPPCCRRP